MKFRKAILARLALAVIWIFAIEAMTVAAGELVRITSPKEGQQVSGRVRVQVQTTVEDPAYLIFTVDGARPHSTNVQPYCYEFDAATLPDGQPTLGAEVYSRLGLLGESPLVTVRVVNSPVAPAAAAMVQRPAGKQPAPVKDAAPAEVKPATIGASPAEVKPATIGASPRMSMTPILTLSPGTASAARGAAPGSGGAIQAGAQGALTVVLDGRPLAFDVAPSIFEGRAFGALRTVVQQSGGVVAWLAPSQAVARRSGKLLQVTVGSSAATINHQPVDLGSAVRLAQGRTLVPLRATCTPLGYTVAWAGGERTVRLCSTEPTMQVKAVFAR
jgi:hypothetical protein